MLSLRAGYVLGNCFRRRNQNMEKCQIEISVYCQDKFDIKFKTLQGSIYSLDLYHFLQRMSMKISTSKAYLALLFFLCATLVLTTTLEEQKTSHTIDQLPKEIFQFADQQIRNAFDQDSDLSFEQTESGHILFNYQSGLTVELAYDPEINSFEMLSYSQEGPRAQESRECVGEECEKEREASSRQDSSKKSPEAEIEEAREMEREKVQRQDRQQERQINDNSADIKEEEEAELVYSALLTSGEIDDSYIPVSFVINNYGYLMALGKGSEIWIFQLDSGYSIIRKSSKVINQNINQQINNFIAEIVSLQASETTQSGSVTRVRVISNKENNIEGEKILIESKRRADEEESVDIQVTTHRESGQIKVNTINIQSVTENSGSDEGQYLITEKEESFDERGGKKSQKNAAVLENNGQVTKINVIEDEIAEDEGQLVQIKKQTRKQFEGEAVKKEGQAIILLDENKKPVEAREIQIEYEAGEPILKVETAAQFKEGEIAKSQSFSQKKTVVIQNNEKSVVVEQEKQHFDASENKNVHDKIELIDDEQGKPIRMSETITIEKKGENTVVDELTIDYKEQIQIKTVKEIEHSTGEVVHTEKTKVNLSTGQVFEERDDEKKIDEEDGEDITEAEKEIELQIEDEVERVREAEKKIDDLEHDLSQGTSEYFEIESEELNTDDEGNKIERQVIVEKTKPEEPTIKHEIITKTDGEHTKTREIVTVEEKQQEPVIVREFQIDDEGHELETEILIEDQREGQPTIIHEISTQIVDGHEAVLQTVVSKQADSQPIIIDEILTVDGEEKDIDEFIREQERDEQEKHEKEPQQIEYQTRQQPVREEQRKDDRKESEIEDVRFVENPADWIGTFLNENYPEMLSDYSVEIQDIENLPDEETSEYTYFLIWINLWVSTEQFVPYNFKIRRSVQTDQYELEEMGYPEDLFNLEIDNYVVVDVKDPQIVDESFKYIIDKVEKLIPEEFPKDSVVEKIEYSLPFYRISYRVYGRAITILVLYDVFKSEIEVLDIQNQTPGQENNREQTMADQFNPSDMEDIREVPELDRDAIPPHKNDPSSAEPKPTPTFIKQQPQKEQALTFKPLNPIDDREVMRYASRILERRLPEIEETYGAPVLSGIDYATKSDSDGKWWVFKFYINVNEDEEISQIFQINDKTREFRPYSKANIVREDNNSLDDKREREQQLQRERQLQIEAKERQRIQTERKQLELKEKQQAKERARQEELERKNAEAETLRIKEEAQAERRAIAQKEKQKERKEAERIRLEEEADAERARIEAEKARQREREEAEKIQLQKEAQAERKRVEAEKTERREREEAQRIRLEEEERARIEAEKARQREREEAEKIQLQKEAQAERKRVEAEKTERREREEAQRIRLEEEERARIEAEKARQKEREEAEKIRLERAQKQRQQKEQSSERQTVPKKPVEIIREDNTEKVYSSDSLIFGSQYKHLQLNSKQGLKAQTLFENLLGRNNLIKIDEIDSFDYKEEADGVYYRIVVRSQTQRKYLVTLFEEPGTSYSEILEFRLEDVIYPYSQEIQLEEIPNTEEFAAVSAFLSKKYQDLFSVSKISFIGEASYSDGILYRIVYRTLTGRYQVIIFINEELTPLIVSSQKMDEGYRVKNISEMSQQEELSVEQFSTVLLNELTKMNIEVKAEDITEIMFRELPGVGTYIRIFFRSSKINFVATGFHFEGSSQIKLISVEKLPASEKAEAEKINGCQIQIGEHCYDCLDGYVRVDHSCYAGKNAEIVIKQTIGQQYPDEKKEKIEQIEVKEIKREEEKQDAPRYTEVRGDVSGGGQATGSSYSYQYSSSGEDPSYSSSYYLKRYRQADEYTSHCLQFSRTSPECIRCVYRYYTKNGICVKIQNQCSSYNQETGECYDCYTGFYLDQQTNKCVSRDPLCLETDHKGVCQKCYKNYVLRNNKCYYVGQQEEPRQYYEDQLCMQWDGDYCMMCVPGTYKSSKTGLCTIQDPHCMVFDEQKEECSVCRRGWQARGQECVRKW